MRSTTSFPPRTILVPLDVTAGAFSGLEAARRLAERWASRVELVHVDPGPPPAFHEGLDYWTLDVLRQMHSELRERVALAVRDIPHSSTHVLSGAPETIIPRLAADAAADLVVLAPRRRRTLPRFLSGSLAEASVHAATVPVLTVREAPGPGWPRRILAPFKWARHTDRILLVARDWARSLDAELGLLHVFEGGREDDMEQRAVVEHALSVLGEPSPKLRWHWAVGRPFEEIPKTAAEGGYDLVVVSERAHDGWFDGLFGTTAERVLRASSVPVLSVPVRRAVRRKREPRPESRTILL